MNDRCLGLIKKNTTIRASLPGDASVLMMCMQIQAFGYKGSPTKPGVALEPIFALKSNESSSIVT